MKIIFFSYVFYTEFYIVYLFIYFSHKGPATTHTKYANRPDLGKSGPEHRVLITSDQRAARAAMIDRATRVRLADRHPQRHLGRTYKFTSADDVPIYDSA
jgi:hypothetical protein